MVKRTWTLQKARVRQIVVTKNVKQVDTVDDSFGLLEKNSALRFEPRSDVRAPDESSQFY